MAKRGKQSRRVSRRNRRASRRASRSRRQRGGWLVLNPASVDDTTMNSASALSGAQGKEFAALHVGQHGGAAVPLVGAPLDTSGVLDSSLREAARVLPLDQATGAIQGMSDQSGGARRKSSRKSRKSRKGRKGSRKSRKGRRSSRKGRKASRRNRQRGGATFNPADVSAPGMLLPAELEAKAVGTMNPEWKLAEDPTSFTPKA